MQNPLGQKYPIFILGISPRCGTNYISALLRKHPSVLSTNIIWEDFLLCHSTSLQEYVDNCYKRWPGTWSVENRLGPKELLYQALGNGLAMFLYEQVERQIEHAGNENKSDTSELIVATKTPSVNNLQFFFKFFPFAKLLILIRDGRSVSESFVKSFDGNYENAMRIWRQGAKQILEFDNVYKNTDFQYKIIKYEQLYLETQKQLKDIFSFLELDSSVYDFQSIEDMEILGSSTFRNKDESKFKFKVRKSMEGFDPLERWKTWDEKLHRRFNYLAVDYMNKLGYEVEKYKNNIFWTLWNKRKDFQWFLYHCRTCFWLRIFLWKYIRLMLHKKRHSQ